MHSLNSTSIFFQSSFQKIIFFVQLCNNKKCLPMSTKVQISTLKIGNFFRQPMKKKKKKKFFYVPSEINVFSSVRSVLLWSNTSSRDGHPTY